MTFNSERSPRLERRWDLFVFDWDGTIMDTTALIAIGIQKACVAMGYPEPSLELCKSTIGLSWGDIIARACPECPVSRYAEFGEHYRAWCLTREGDVPVVPGLERLLRNMHAAGLRLAVATGKSRRGLDRVFARTGLGEVFEDSITADESFSKPNPAMLEELSVRCAVPVERMVMIGDAVFDLQMAHNAGAAGVGVTFGASSVETLAQCNPVGIAHTVEELAAVLGVQDLL